MTEQAYTLTHFFNDVVDATYEKVRRRNPSVKKEQVRRNLALFTANFVVAAYQRNVHLEYRNLGELIDKCLQGFCAQNNISAGRDALLIDVPEAEKVLTENTKEMPQVQEQVKYILGGLKNVTIDA